MDKRYQVFVSSTYADLKEERQKVIQTLMELNCIPAGMELFPAADEEQFEFIKRVIDYCDYYLLIIGGRYGSLTEQRISYTEQEYNYALSRELKVIALIHNNPDEIPFNKSEQNPELRDLLKKFRDRIQKKRLVKFWSSADELPGLVALNLSNAIERYPAIGWVRANRASSEELLSEINDLRKQNSQLQDALSNLPKFQPAPISDLAGLDEAIELHGKHVDGNHTFTWKTKATWGDLFGCIAPYLVKHPSEAIVKDILKMALFDRSGGRGRSVTLDDQDFQTVAIQLKALGLISVSHAKTVGAGMDLFWSATPAGERLTFELRVVRSANDV